MYISCSTRCTKTLKWWSLSNCADIRLLARLARFARENGTNVLGAAFSAIVTLSWICLLVPSLSTWVISVLKSNQHTLSHSWLNTNCVRCTPCTIKKYLRFSVNEHSLWSIKWEQSRTSCRVRYIGTWYVCPCWRDTDSCTGDRTAGILHRTCCSRPPALGWSRRQTGCELFLCDGSRSAGPKLGLTLHNI